MLPDQRSGKVHLTLEDRLSHCAEGSVQWQELLYTLCFGESMAISNLCMSEQSKVASQMQSNSLLLCHLWRNYKIWKEKKVRDVLRVKRSVNQDCILIDTCFPNLRLEVTPMYRSRFSGYAEAFRVLFFLGFSTKGPLAPDIEAQC